MTKKIYLETLKSAMRRSMYHYWLIPYSQKWNVFHNMFIEEAKKKKNSSDNLFYLNYIVYLKHILWNVAYISYW